jgi:hypothetical protein
VVVYHSGQMSLTQPVKSGSVDLAPKDASSVVQE